MYRKLVNISLRLSKSLSVKNVASDQKRTLKDSSANEGIAKHELMISKRTTSENFKVTNDKFHSNVNA